MSSSEKYGGGNERPRTSEAQRTNEAAHREEAGLAGGSPVHDGHPSPAGSARPVVEGHPVLGSRQPADGVGPGVVNRPVSAEARPGLLKCQLCENITDLFEPLGPVCASCRGIPVARPDADDLLAERVDQLDAICTWLASRDPRVAADLHDRRDRFLLPLAKRAAAESGMGKATACESCETRPASTRCDGCIVEDYQAAEIVSDEEKRAIRAATRRVSREEDRARFEGSVGPGTSKALPSDDEGLAIRTLEYEASVREQEVVDLRSFVGDLAEHDCAYGDDCPTFGSRHGRCVGCRARSALGTRSEGVKP